MKIKTAQCQTEYWDILSEEIEAAIKQHDPATAYAMIRRLRGSKQRIEYIPILDKQRNLLCSTSEKIGKIQRILQ